MNNKPGSTASFSPPGVLEGSFVRLEPLGVHHVSGLCAAGLDPDLWRITTSTVTSPAEIREYVVKAVNDAEKGDAFPFAIVATASGSVVGSTRFGNLAYAHRRVEIGWTWIAPRWQRTAVNTETKYLMLRHAFDTWGCLRVEFKTDALNTRSRAALTKLGAREEGTLRSHMITENGRVRDSVYYSIIASEWPSVEQQLQARLTLWKTQR